MSRRILSIFAIVMFAASAAFAVTTGFSSTFEEKGFPYPRFDKNLNADFPAPVGVFELHTLDNTQITTDDPVNGPLPCDPTTSKALVGDTSRSSWEVRYAFPMAAGGPVVVEDKAVLGAETGHAFGLEFGVYSASTHRYEPVFQFGPDWEVLVYGEPVEYLGANLTYNNLWENDCAAGIDNHFTVRVQHEMTSGTVRVEVELHGDIADVITVGPFAMNMETQIEGIGGMYTLAPRGVGRTYVDTMVCVGTSPVIEPTRGEGGIPGTRSRY